MNSIKAVAVFLLSGTGRRLLAFVVGTLVVLLHNKLGLDLDPDDVTKFSVLVLGYVTQSAVREAVSDHADAKVEAAKIVAVAALAPAPAEAPK